MGASEAIAFARNQLGKPYVFGATGPNSYDCSGLVQAACAAGGVHIARDTYGQIFDGHEVSRNELMPGDLIFPDIGHVQLYVGNNRVIESPHTGAFVREAAMWGFWRARRVFDGAVTTDFVTPVGNPIDDLKGLKDAFNSLQELTSKLTSSQFWKRVGVASLAVLLIVLGIVFMNRRRIEGAIGGVAKAGEIIA